MVLFIQIGAVFSVFSSLVLSFVFLFRDLPKNLNAESSKIYPARETMKKIHIQQPVSTRRSRVEKSEIKYNNIIRARIDSKDRNNLYDRQSNRAN